MRQKIKSIVGSHAGSNNEAGATKNFIACKVGLI